MSSLFRKLIPSFLKQDSQDIDQLDEDVLMFDDDDLEANIDDAEEPDLSPFSPTSNSESPESLQSLRDSQDVLPKRNIDRPINPRRLPDGFVESLSDVLAEEDDPYTKLILYSHIVCGTRIDVLRDRFVVNTPRGKQYIASREFIRHRLNKSLDRIRERYFELNGSDCFVSTIDDSDEPYRADFASNKSIYSSPEVSDRSHHTPSSKGAVVEHESEEESGYQKEEVQGASSNTEKRKKYPRAKLLFVLDEEDIEETDFDGLGMPASQGSDL